MKQYATGSFSAEELLKKLVDQAWFEEDLRESCNPLYMYQEEGKTSGDTVWLYSTTRKTYVSMKLNFSIAPIEDIREEHSDNNVMCLICHDVYLIPYDNIRCVGYN